MSKIRTKTSNENPRNPYHFDPIPLHLFLFLFEGVVFTKADILYKVLSFNDIYNWINVK